MTTLNTNQPTDESGPPRRPRVLRRVTVTRVRQLSPRTICVTFTGNDLAAFAWNGPAAHIKLVFPEDGQDEPAPPQPGGPRPTRMRTYTPRRFDPSVPELDVTFVLHGEGPAAQWAAQARPGQVLFLGGPGPSYQLDPEAEWLLLAGDAAALPAIETILETLPPRVRAHVLVEVTDANEERALTTAAELQLTWLRHTATAPQPNAALEAALRELELPAGRGRVYVGCEAGAVRRIRRHLLEERGLDPALVVTRGYWKLGATNHTDHDYGMDEER
jgi:NADPH-dependent ferric siderophore reductase